MPQAADILADPNWLAHRYDEANDGFRFVRLDRDGHGAATFITDEYLSDTDQFQFVDRSAAEEAQIGAGPRHFVFHSAYCCSTMVARAFEIAGLSHGLKEPQVLNDILGWRRRGASDAEIKTVLKLSTDLLARPFGAGEATIVKPSNIVSPLAENLLELNPDAKALFLHAPIDGYLRSIAKKGLWGRRWVREVLLGTINDGYLIGGFVGQELLELTDLQVAALGWLSQHSLFNRLMDQFGAERIRTLNSEDLLSDPEAAMRKLFNLFGIALIPDALRQIIDGPAFNTHSKDAAMEFDAGARAIEQAKLAESYGEEIDMVANWAAAVAQSQGFDLRLRSNLLG